MERKKALIAMSGGVDSSVAAYLTLQEGFSCIGATMRLFEAQEDEPESTCCSLEQVEDARSVAFRLGIPFYVFNFKEDFRHHVMDAFVHDYEQGLTPNPCIECNRHLKFDRLLRRAAELGCEYVVTGHYAQVAYDESTQRYLLRRGADPGKDQSYFLACLTQAQLAHIRFPLGHLSKPEVRQIAAEQGFINARKRDSQDVCFIPDGDYRAFLERYTGKYYPDGDFLDCSGHCVGRHHGAVGYTLGQRKGLGLAMGEPVYVCEKDMVRNTVTVGPNEALFHRGLTADNWNWISIEAPSQPLHVTAKARSRMDAQPATVYPEENGLCRVVFDQPQRALTPGQAIVLYDGDIVVGSGTIQTICPDPEKSRVCE